MDKSFSISEALNDFYEVAKEIWVPIFQSARMGQMGNEHVKVLNLIQNIENIIVKGAPVNIQIFSRFLIILSS